jgi:hypothetical protein
MIVRNTRGLVPGDTVARLLPSGLTDGVSFKLTDVITGHLLYRNEEHFVYFLDGLTSPFGDKTVKMIVTENIPWCVTRGSVQ